MKTKISLILMMLIASLAVSAHSQERYYGVNDKGQRFSSEFKNYYMVHGGCREANNSSLTEIWLFLSETVNTPYHPNDYRVLRGEMYLQSKYGSFESIAICSFLRRALETQTAIKMDLIPHSYVTNFFQVRSLDKKQIYTNLELIEDNQLLENFSVRRGN